jgi:integrase/recombinase XerD
MHQEGLLAHDLSPVIITPKRHMQLPRHVPASGAITSLLNAVDGKDSISRRDRCILELFYATGIRSQELRTITVDDYNCTEGTLLIHGKGSKDRIVPVGWWMVTFLDEYLQYVRPLLVRTKTDLMFISKGGSALQRNVVGYIVTKYAKKAGLDTITPHTLRHACATHLLQNGADIRYVQELLGHAYLSSTQIYTKVDISYLKKAHAQYHPRECGCNEP